MGSISKDRQHNYFHVIHACVRYRDHTQGKQCRPPTLVFVIFPKNSFDY
jgi:hypothetical protein